MSTPSHPFDSAVTIAVIGLLAIAAVMLVYGFWLLLDLVLTRLSEQEAARVRELERQRADAFNRARDEHMARFRPSNSAHPRKDDPHHAA